MVDRERVAVILDEWMIRRNEWLETVKKDQTQEIDTLHDMLDEALKELEITHRRLRLAQSVIAHYQEERRAQEVEFLTFTDEEDYYFQEERMRSVRRRLDFDEDM